MIKELIAGTRGSRLALAQTELVTNEIKKLYPHIHIQKKIIKTKGDKLLNSPLNSLIDKGFFTKELEHALQNKEIDFAVHSLKDLPIEIPPDLTCEIFPQMEPQNDALIAKECKTIHTIPLNGTIATGSIRRTLQLKKTRPDLHIVDIRGNIETRIEKLKKSDWDGIILASAGLKRLGLSHLITQILPFDIMLPAPGQGIIGIECRKDKELLELLAPINHHKTSILARAQRAFLKAMGGGCQIPLGCTTCFEGESLKISGLYMPDGYYIDESFLSDIDSSLDAGKILAQKIMRKLSHLKNK